MTARVLVVLLLTCELTAQVLWYASYQQGVDAFKRNDYALARRRFLEALTNDQAPRTRGRRVIYHGLLRDEFIPEYYLALIAAHDKQWDQALRYADAAESYMRGDKDYARLVETRTAAIDARGTSAPVPPRPGSTASIAPNTTRRDPPAATTSITPTTSTAPPLVDSRAAAAQRQSDSLLGQGSRALANGTYAIARDFARQARNLAVDVAGADELLQRITAAEQAGHARTQQQVADLLGQRRWIAAREVLDRYAREGGDSTFVDATRTAIARGLDQDAARALERAAVTAFYRGNYQAALATFARMSGSQVTPRVLFYQACTNAALALMEGPAGAPRLTRARALYAQSDPKRNSFDRHRRFVSPHIISALER